MIIIRSDPYEVLYVSPTVKKVGGNGLFPEYILSLR